MCWVITVGAQLGGSCSTMASSASTPPVDEPMATIWLPGMKLDAAAGPCGSRSGRGPRGARGVPTRVDTGGPALQLPPRCASQEPPIDHNITAQIRGPKGQGGDYGKAFWNPHFASRHDRGCRRLRGGDAAHPLGDRPGQAAQGRADAALLGHVRQARREHHLRHRDADRREGRQARRPRDPVHQARRQVQARERAAERRPSRQARQGRRADRHGPLGRADGHPQGRVRERHADHRAQRRQRRGDAQAVRQERVPHLVHELAAGLRHGRRGRQEGASRRRVGHLGLRRRRRKRRGLQGRLREGRRPGAARP